MKTKKIIEKLRKVELELSEKERVELIMIAMRYPYHITTTDIMEAEKILSENRKD